MPHASHSRIVEYPTHNSNTAMTAMTATTRTFHCTEAGSSKFWTIATSADEKTFTVTFGKIGTAGQSKEKSFTTAEACAKEAAKLIREKTGKGYIEQGATAANPIQTIKPAVTSAPVKSAAAPVVATGPAKTKFLKADYKAAAKTLHSLDLAAIDDVIASGIPLDELKFAPTASFVEDTAIGTIIDCVSSYYIANPDKIEHTRKAEDAILRLIDAGAAIPINRAWSFVAGHLFKILDRLIAAGLDLNARDASGLTILADLKQDPIIVEQLLARGADSHSAPGLLHTVAKFGPHALLKRLVEENKLPLDEYYEDQTPAEAADDYYQKITCNNLPIAESCAHDPHFANRRDNTGKLPAEQVAFYREQTLNRNYLLALAAKAKPQTASEPESATQPTLDSAAALPATAVVPMPTIDPLAGTTTITKATPTKRFTKAQGKAAYETFISLDRAAIDAVIATGIPLDESIFGERSTSTAVEALIMHAFLGVRSGSLTVAQLDSLDAIIMQLFINGADPMKLRDDIAICAYSDLPRALTYLLQKHLAAGYKINDPDRYGQSLIHRAYEYHRTTEVLIAAGMSTNDRPDFLSHAVIHYPHDVFRRLIETYKTPADTTNTAGNTPLEAAEQYIAKNPDKKLPADSGKNINYLRALTQSTAVDTPAASSIGNPDADRRLLNACKQRELESTNAIARALKEGANPNIRDAGGCTPLHHLAAVHYPHIIEQGISLLIPAGADPHALDNEGRTPIFYFFTGFHGDTAAVRALVNNGVDPKHKDKHGRNALAHMLATAPVEEDHDARQTTAALLHAGVPAIACDEHGNTALHLMVTQQDLGGEAEGLVKLAISKGNDVNARNAAGRTALHLAVMRPEDDRHTFFDYFIQELLRNKADINAQGPDGNTAIHLCAVPDEDLHLLIAGNPDLGIANKAGVTVLQHIKDLGYYNTEKHPRLTKDIDALLAEPASARQLPALEWTPHELDQHAAPAGPSGAPLKIASSFHIQKNDADDDFCHIGANRLAITGNIPENVTVFDTINGKELWHLEACAGGSHNIAFDGRAVYIARENLGSRFVTAHHPDTGEQIWECGMSSSYKQFGTRLLCTPGYVVHASQSASKIYPIDKKTGKKYIAPLAKPFPQQKAGNRHDWGAHNSAPYWRSNALIPFGDKLLVLGIKPKEHILAIDEYDLSAKGAHTRTIAELPEEVLPIGHHLRDGALYLFTTDGHLRKIDIATGKTLADHDHSPTVEHTFTNLPHTIAGNRIHYILASDCGGYRSCHTYDLAADKMLANHELKKELPLRIHRPASDGKHIYCFGSHGSTGRDIAIYDIEKQETVTELKLPNYGGYDGAEQRLVLGDAIYILQKGGLEYGEDSSVLHRVEQ